MFLVWVGLIRERGAGFSGDRLRKEYGIGFIL